MLTKDQVIERINEKMTIFAPDGTRIDTRVHVAPGTHAILDVILEEIVGPLETRIAQLENRLSSTSVIS